ncbi:hypothetical protein AK812_SmicGene47774, partial [Symbiodinium microadriaticum]
MGLTIQMEAQERELVATRESTQEKSNSKWLTVYLTADLQ